MLPLLSAGVVMGFLVGSITIGITLYTAVLERFKEYGTMKALGATDRFLFGVILKQSLISLLIGTAIGLILGGFANQVINQWVPGMTAKLDGMIMMQTVFAGLGMAVLSTGLPLWRLLRLDPMEAFRS
jgi:putative ABC transport system permease protein